MEFLFFCEDFHPVSFAIYSTIGALLSVSPTRRHRVLFFGCGYAGLCLCGESSSLCPPVYPSASSSPTEIRFNNAFVPFYLVECSFGDHAPFSHDRDFAGVSAEGRDEFHVVLDDHH